MSEAISAPSVPDTDAAPSAFASAPPTTPVLSLSLSLSATSSVLQPQVAEATDVPIARMSDGVKVHSADSSPCSHSSPLPLSSRAPTIALARDEQSTAVPLVRSASNTSLVLRSRVATAPPASLSLSLSRSLSVANDGLTPLHAEDTVTLSPSSAVPLATVLASVTLPAYMHDALLAVHPNSRANEAGSRQRFARAVQLQCMRTAGAHTCSANRKPHCNCLSATASVPLLLDAVSPNALSLRWHSLSTSPNLSPPSCSPAASRRLTKHAAFCCMHCSLLLSLLAVHSVLSMMLSDRQERQLFPLCASASSTCYPALRRTYCTAAVCPSIYASASARAGIQPVSPAAVAAPSSCCTLTTTVPFSLCWTNSACSELAEGRMCQRD